MHFKPIISTVVVLAGVMLSGGIALGTSVPNLDITENSSTSLSAVLTGTSVTVSVAPGHTSDSWVLTFSTPLSATGVYWLEPNSSTSANLVELDANDPGQLDVFSDISAPPSGGLNNGDRSNAFFLDLVGAGQQNMTVEFNDNGDGPSVPEATSTLPLLSASLVGLGILAKRLKA